jgi:hypothetical protein
MPRAEADKIHRLNRQTHTSGVSLRSGHGYDIFTQTTKGSRKFKDAKLRGLYYLLFELFWRHEVCSIYNARI